ncbi:coiled-coil domain-containing protein 186-like [Anopheles marshallii]|uniref:coiled-coil domain-containing protein 186-like n=1 Tax=Anopheles marshallii TaxID=1521116 RepID=UPI00237BD621|nr:coiled-coil domain-containing protein 186-like [Anopheles marshallii]
MSNAAFIEDWNSIVPFKIKAIDLEKPTEQFVYKAILHFFKLMHYDVSSYENMYSESTETITSKRVELVARINYIYQLCSDSKQTSFFYIDLVKPTGKKIVHLLKILLNYLFYINMVKESVQEKANLCTEKYFELKVKLNQKQIMKEETKIRANDINRHIDDLKNRLPQLKSQIDTLHQRKNALQESIATLKMNDQNLADQIIKLKVEHSELTDQIVTDEEAASMRSTKNSLEKEIETLCDTEKQLQKTYEIHVASINEIRPCNALLEKLLQFEFDDSCKNLRKELIELNTLYDKLQKQHTSLMNVSDGLQENCKEIEALIAEKKQELDIRTKVSEKSDRKNDHKLLEKEKHLKALQDTNEIFEQMLAIQRLEVQRVVEMTEKSLMVIKQNLIE